MTLKGCIELSYDIHKITALPLYLQIDKINYSCEINLENISKNNSDNAKHSTS